MYLYLAGANFYEFSSSISTGFIIAMWLAHTIKFVILAYFLIKFVSEHLDKEYIIEDGHLLVKDGFVTVNQREYELKQLKEMKIVQGPLGRLLHYGNLELKFGALGFHKTVLLVDVAQPEIYMKQYSSYLDN